MFLLYRAWLCLTFKHHKNVLFMIVKQTLSPYVTICGNIVRRLDVSGCMLQAPAWPLTPLVDGVGWEGAQMVFRSLCGPWVLVS